MKLIESEDHGLQATPWSNHSLSKIKAFAMTTTEACAIPTSINSENANRREKLQKVLNELKLSELPFHSSLKHSLVAVIERCLDAFAADDDDLGHTELVEHAINTGNVQPFKEKLRPLPFSRRDFVDKEIDRFLKH